MCNSNKGKKSTVGTPFLSHLFSGFQWAEHSSLNLAPSDQDLGNGHWKKEESFEVGVTGGTKEVVRSIRGWSPGNVHGKAD